MNNPKDIWLLVGMSLWLPILMGMLYLFFFLLDKRDVDTRHNYDAQLYELEQNAIQRKIHEQNIEEIKKNYPDLKLYISMMNRDIYEQMLLVDSLLIIYDALYKMDSIDAVAGLGAGNGR